TSVGRNPHMAKVKKRGLKVSGVWGRHVFKRLKAYTSVKPQIGKQELILITTKAYDTEGAIKQVLPLVGDETLVVSAQNGIGNEETIAKFVGQERTLGCMAIFGAILTEPGSVKVTVYASECLVGSLSGNEETPKRIARTFSEAGIPTLPTDDIIREKWMKAFYNMALNPLSTILKVPYGTLGKFEETKTVMRKILEEAFMVAERKGVNLKFDCNGYFEFLLKRQLPPTAKHESSMLQDIIKGKRTEIEFLNGAIVGLGETLGVETPVNETISNIVKAMEHLARAKRPETH
ncbi:TPA: 2-dehydropantoate 2-reductase, partial [Candidatus Bathyarchaeota archaeon]|nr:2-dehydropantoate 2-reductase [Candidatus Bathyarchaeota archaeon]